MIREKTETDNRILSDIIMTLYFKTVGFKLRFSNRHHLYMCLVSLKADTVAVFLRPLDYSDIWFESR
jgi:hypothetical protein